MKAPIAFLTLYVNPAWNKSDIFSPLLFPFWGNPLREFNLFAKELFDSFSFDTDYYGITDDITKADAVFLPYRQAWAVRRFPGLLEECALAAKAANLPLFVDGLGDGEHPLGIDNAYVMRYGGYRFLTQEQSELGLPSHIRWEPNRIEVPTQADDLWLRCVGGDFSPRKKQEGKPIVGFAGQVQTTFKNMLHRRLDELPIYLRGIFDDHYMAMSEGIFWRRHALSILKNSRLVEGNLTGRNFFSGGGKQVEGKMKGLQKEFVDIILNSDYAIDIRGYANASVRLFEILSLGRIPVILDTERILPFKDEVDWGAFSLIVDFRDIRKLPQIIADFHASLSSEKFEGMQRAARNAFVNHFRVDAQMPHILRAFNALRDNAA